MRSVCAPRSSINAYATAACARLGRDIEEVSAERKQLTEVAMVKGEMQWVARDSPSASAPHSARSSERELATAHAAVHPLDADAPAPVRCCVVA